MLINPIGLFYLLGVGLALLLIISLVLKKGDQSPSKKLLIGLLVSISILLLQEALIISKPPRWLYYIFGAVVTSWYFVPPLLYLFVKSIVVRDFRFQPKQLLLFALPILLLLEWVLALLGVRINSAALFANTEQYSMVWILFFLLMSLGYGGKCGYYPPGGTLKPEKPTIKLASDLPLWLWGHLASLGHATTIFYEHPTIQQSL